ncbi:MAG: cytochrome c oxidase assembly protein [Sphingomonadaceae bacterium]
MIAGATYCGAAPLPGTLAERFNLDPVVIAALGLCAALQWIYLKREERNAALPLLGWLVAGFAFLSPLCALSVALFAARIGQHMILMLIAAPLIAIGLPKIRSNGSTPLWGAVGAFFLALWFWHMPAPYTATFRSTFVYWTMHLTLFGSAIWLWHHLLGHERETAVTTLAAGAVASMQMSLLGAIICLAARPMYPPHFVTTAAWGLSPMADQQLGGVLMWVPGCVIFLWLAVRTTRMAIGTLEDASA